MSNVHLNKETHHMICMNIIFLSVNELFQFGISSLSVVSKQAAISFK